MSSATVNAAFGVAMVTERETGGGRSGIDGYGLGKFIIECEKVITVPDNRWERVDIKTVGLLPNCLAKQAAKEAGAKEAWYVDANGFVTEGSSTNAWIVTTDGTLVTRPSGSFSR